MTTKMTTKLTTTIPTMSSDTEILKIVSPTGSACAFKINLLIIMFYEEYFTNLEERRPFDDILLRLLNTTQETWCTLSKDKENLTVNEMFTLCILFDFCLNSDSFYTDKSERPFLEKTYKELCAKCNYPQ